MAAERTDTDVWRVHDGLRSRDDAPIAHRRRRTGHTFIQRRPLQLPVDLTLFLSIAAVLTARLYFFSQTQESGHSRKSHSEK